MVSSVLNMEFVYQQWRVETVRCADGVVEDSELFNNFHDAWAYTRVETDEGGWSFRTLAAAHQFFNNAHGEMFVAAWLSDDDDDDDDEHIKEVRLSFLP